MYAVIRTGGKQYRVAENQVLFVEKLDAEVGSTVALDQVLMVGGEGEPKVGHPFVEGARVEATVLDQIKGPKVVVFKKKRRKNYRRKRGHRQLQTVLRVTRIVAG
ncbi:50S ribosomal protein L21 [bacterium HR40]|nr:50S ribosomal protein L21 [bacterium HR40]